jgi:TRAP-type C4-dicarboxylate transport system permease large subunit
MYTTTTILQTTLTAFVRESWPFLIALLCVLFAITYIRSWSSSCPGCSWDRA